MTQRKADEPKLPVRQLAILAVVRFAEPLALTSVIPYLPEMIQSFGVAQDEVAKWAGLVGAIFSISQSLTAVPWGWASDRIGRKPTILIGLLTTMICFIIWGMSTSLTMAITVRFIQGAGNGNVGIIRTMVAEMVTERVLQPRAFSIMPLVWSVGSVFGPSFGGFFAKPAERFPALFGNNKFLKKFPFALPNIVACVFFLISLLTAMLFLKETLESKRHSPDWGLRLGEKLTSGFRRGPRPSSRVRQHRRSFVDDEATAPLLSQSERDSPDLSDTSAPEHSAKSIFTYQTSMALLCYTILALHSTAFDNILGVFLNYPRQTPDEHNTQLPLKFSGGFGLGSDKIGTIFTVYGIACGLIQFLVFPPLCSYFGVLKCYRFSALLFPITYLAIPYTTLIQHTQLRYAVFLGILLIKGFAGIIGFPCMTIMLTNSAPSLKILGTLNGFATTFSGIGRAVGPAMTGATFTWGVQRGYIIAGPWLLAIVAVTGAVAPWFLEEGEGPSGHHGAAGSDRDIDDLYEECLLDGEEDVSDDDDDYDENRRDEALARAKVAGEAADILGIRHVSAAANAALDNLAEPDEPESDCPPLVSPTRAKHTHNNYEVDGTVRHVRLRRMSATGVDIEADRRDGDWKARRGDDEVEG